MLGTRYGSDPYASGKKALARAKHEGLLDAIPALADRAAAALQPVDSKRLLDRLTLLGMTMLHGKSAEEQRAWLHETVRLLSDLPERIVFDAVDSCVKEPGRVFAPTVGEILAKAGPVLERAERQAANLRQLANLIAEGVEIPEYEPDPWGRPLNHPEVKPCSGEEADAILREFGLRGSPQGDKLAGMLAPDKPKSRSDYIAAGEVPPPIVPPEPLFV